MGENNSLKRTINIDKSLKTPIHFNIITVNKSRVGG